MSTKSPQWRLHKPRRSWTLRCVLDIPSVASTLVASPTELEMLPQYKIKPFLGWSPLRHTALIGDGVKKLLD